MTLERPTILIPECALGLPYSLKGSSAGEHDAWGWRSVGWGTSTASVRDALPSTQKSELVAVIPYPPPLLLVVMRRGFLINLDGPTAKNGMSQDSVKAKQRFNRVPFSPIQPPSPTSAQVVPTIPIPDGHVGCCERVGLSELLKILQNAGENTPPQPVIFHIPTSSTQPSETKTTCITISEARDKLLSRGPYPAIDSSEGCRIRVVDVPGKGKGCVATGAVPRGGLIIRERPLVIAPTVMAFPRNFDRTLIRAMPPNERAALLALNNCYEDKIIGILRTNNWGIGALPGHDAPYGGTGAIISRINHRYVPTFSCPPRTGAPHKRVSCTHV